jgi:hypothetical protein
MMWNIIYNACPRRVLSFHNMSDSEKVLDFSPGSQDNRTRSLVIELVVRQALSGEDWRQKSSSMLEQHKIRPEEIEDELARRRERRTGRREEGSQRRARVLAEVLREMPAGAPREQIVAAFRDRYNQPDRRRARDEDQLEPAAEATTAAEAVELAAAADGAADPAANVDTSTHTPAAKAEESTASQTAPAPADQPAQPAAPDVVAAEPGNQATNRDENKKPWWKRVMFWIK